tara:strand:+ start:509 stop:853 length:345 start_codon:yes stop_codon:yes gene_type:complete
MTVSYKVFDNIVGLRDMTAEEKAQREKDVKEWNDSSAQRKLNKIKAMRLKRLQDTDWMAYSDVTMPDYIKTWRQTLRDLPQNNTTESQYDTLLETTGSFPNKSYVHSVWTQPTS